MKKARASVLLWEICGAVFIIAFGAILHFIYGWTHFMPGIGFFGTVNGSVWEQLKLGFWPLVLFSILEYPFLSKKTKNFFFAKFIGLIVQVTIILTVFYTYSSILKKTILIVDIGSFLLAVIACQAVCFAMHSAKKHHSLANAFSLFGLIFIAATFMLFTYVPPKLDIFKDRITGKYGTEWNVRK